MHPQALLMGGVGICPSEAKLCLQAAEDPLHRRISYNNNNVVGSTQGAIIPPLFRSRWERLQVACEG
jgi:hypothetical protein